MATNKEYVAAHRARKKAQLTGLQAQVAHLTSMLDQANATIRELRATNDQLMSILRKQFQ